MADHDRLTAKQQRFVAALMGARTVEGAALAAGIGERTAWRYLRNPHVQAALREAQAQALAQVTRRLALAVSEALEVLRGIAKDCDAPSGSRVSAARAILENALRFSETTDLMARVEELEERLREFRAESPNNKED